MSLWYFWCGPASVATYHWREQGTGVCTCHLILVQVSWTTLAGDRQQQELPLILVG